MMTDDLLRQRLERIDRKLDEVLEFRDLLLKFVTAGAVRKAAIIAGLKVKGE